MIRWHAAALAAAYLAASALAGAGDASELEAPQLVVVGIGHSNMRGYASEGPVHLDPRVRAWDANRSAWIAVPIPAEPYTLTDGMTPLVNRLAARYTGAAIGLYKLTENGANLHDHWQRGKRPYGELVDTLRALRDRGNVIAAVVVMAGWREAGRFGNESFNRTVEADYRAFLTALREDLACPDLAVVASQVESGFGSPEYEGDEAWQRVWVAIEALAAADAGTWSVSSRGIPTNPGDHHFSRAGNAMWAERVDDTLTQAGVWTQALAQLAAAMPAAVAPPVGAGHAASDVLAVVEGELVRASPSRSLAELGTYRNLMGVREYTVVAVTRGSLRVGERLLVVEQVLRDRQPLPAGARVPGQRVSLTLGAWRAQGWARQEPLDDAFEDLDRPLFWAF